MHGNLRGDQKQSEDVSFCILSYIHILLTCQKDPKFEAYSVVSLQMQHYYNDDKIKGYKLLKYYFHYKRLFALSLSHNFNDRMTFVKQIIIRSIR